MQVYVAKGAGFCFGVKRAIDIAFDEAKKNDKGVYTLGPIIHNPQVIDKLKDCGVEPLEDSRSLKRKDIRAIIIRTHGITRGAMDKLEQSEFDVIDATCPFVKKAQRYAKLLKDEGYQVVILGNREHPEVKGLMSYAGRDAVVVKDSSELPALKTRVGVVVQTTRNVKNLKELLSAVVEQTKELKVYNTLCSSATQRLNETAELSSRVDVMVVVGGKNSANTTELANLCRSLSVSTHHVETSSELKKSWFRDVSKVGVAAGASTPQWLIDDVVEKIKHIGGKGL